MEEKAFPKRSRAALDLFIEYWLLIFYITTIIYFEFIYRLWNFKSISLDYLFPVLFAFSVGTVLFLISSFFRANINKCITFLLTIILTLCYNVQLIYFSIFHTPLSFYSLTGAEDALNLSDIVFTAIEKNTIAIIMIFLPTLFLILISRRFSFIKLKPPALYIILLLFITSYTVSIMCVNLSDDKTVSKHTLYYEASSPELSVVKLGLMTTMRLDLERLILGFLKNKNDSTDAVEIPINNRDKDKDIEAKDVWNPTTTPSSISIKPKKAPSNDYNVMNIDFKDLISGEKDHELRDMHKYFSTVTPTKKNKYTGIFKGNNLILITAESFSPHAISKELTPTLYKLSTSGFVFRNFYNPVWGVSTSDGEYVACTGLIPKSGVWSFAKSGKNLLPFVMGNQFKKLDYITKAYHDHTYTYYKRNLSHPNMGYDYKAVGNGLKLKQTWPESDLEMVNVTSEEYIGTKPFHIYYMTVSGHMNYSFSGNYIDKKNKPYVDKLPYSEPSKAYIAGNLELEFAIKTLIRKLEAAGIADKTVIAISPDHYPYGLPRECIDELSGHKLEDNFELYKSTFILWKEGMKTTVIDKPCSSLDINPTLSNLFGLNYDSRLLMGHDILSDSPSMVIFSNRSWITDKAMYNSVTNTLIKTEKSKIPDDYIRKTNKIVSDKFKYSAKILETDYYRKFMQGSFR